MKTIITLLFSLSALAEPNSVLSAALDLRPSWTANKGSVHSENELDLALNIAPNTSLGYVQEFGIAEKVEAFDGYLKLSRESLFSPLSLNVRLYTPTKAEEREAGFVSALRTDWILDLPLSSILSLQFIESPRLNWYSQPNKNFENRFEIAPMFSLLKESLNLKVALVLENIRQADNSWAHNFWISPEAIYSLNATMGFGLAYYSQNLVSEDLSTTALSDGISSGVIQLVFQQTL